MKFKFFIASVLVLLAFVIAAVGGYLVNLYRTRGNQVSTNTPSTDKHFDITVVGVFRSGGLSGDEKTKFGLKNSDYQVTDFSSDTNSEIKGYYLDYSPVPASQEGNCVVLTANYKDPNNKAVARDLYQRLPVIDGTTVVVAKDFCRPYTEAVKQYPKESVKQKLTGVLNRIRRPAPDINYDYTLNLDTSFVDNSNSSGRALNITDLAMTPATNDVWLVFEKNMTKKVEVEGYYLWGYAESKYFEVLSAKPAS